MLGLFQGSRWVAAAVVVVFVVATWAERSGREGPKGPDGPEAKQEEMFDPSKQLGATAPLLYFDPMGYCKLGDKAAFRQLRSAELKHGRVAMMACAGALAQHSLRIPGFEDVPPGLAAPFTQPGAQGFCLLVLAAGGFEVVLWKDDESRDPGDFGDPLAVGIRYRYKESMRNRELNNGRFAMFAAVGICVAELWTGKDAAQQLGL